MFLNNNGAAEYVSDSGRETQQNAEGDGVHDLRSAA
jgi:hypothetical protein